MLVVVAAASVDGTLNAHLVEQRAVPALAVIAKRRVGRVEVLQRCHRRQIGILIALERPDVVRVDVLGTG